MIANTSNGEKILYDINPIKMVEQAIESATSTTKEIISQEFKVVKELFSEKGGSVYDTMGETERVIKENEKLRADVERLRERMKLERTVTHGNVLNNNQLLSVAGHLRSPKPSLQEDWVLCEFYPFYCEQLRLCTNHCPR